MVLNWTLSEMPNASGNWRRWITWERFDLEYVADGTRKRPVMIHRAPFGSLND